MSIKHLVTAACLAAFSIPTLAFYDFFFRIDDAKYLPGDCITPTDQSLSFYGHYAKVMGVVRNIAHSQDGSELGSEFVEMDEDFANKIESFMTNLEERD